MQEPTETTPQWAFHAPQEAPAPSNAPMAQSTTVTIKAGDTTALVHHSPGVDIKVQFPPGVDVYNWIVVLNAEQFQLCLSRPLNHDVSFTWSMTAQKAQPLTK